MQHETLRLFIIGTLVALGGCASSPEVGTGPATASPNAATVEFRQTAGTQPGGGQTALKSPPTQSGYYNPPGSPVRKPILNRLPAMLGRFLQHFVDPQTNDRSHILDEAAVRSQLERRPDENTITWIGHMTTLMNIDGRYVLTDPWWSNYGSPIPGLGPRRYAPPALAIDELPQIDVIVVSHSHYDHFDLNAVSRIRGRDKITAVVPLGLGRFFRERGYGEVHELDWEQTVTANGLSITALPAIHWSQRQPFRKNDTLWASFAIEGPSGIRVFFGGDTDHGPIHADLGARLDSFDVALLSIGGFHNDGVHCAPESCVQLGADVDADVLIPLHWGTIYLGEGPPQLLAQRFKKAADTAGLDREQIWEMQIGETRALPPARGRAEQFAADAAIDSAAPARAR